MDTHELYMIFIQSRQREGEGERWIRMDYTVHVGCAVLLCLVCLTVLASFFLPSLISH